MGKVMIDTNVLIYLIEKAPVEKLVELYRNYELYVCGVVAFEFLVGVYRTNRLKLKDILEKYFFVVPITYDIIVKASEIEAKLIERGMMLDPRDVLIAATAIVHNMPLWTYNIKDFKRLEKFGLTIESPSI